jgi:cell wall-associated NlpC family hydrolase
VTTAALNVASLILNGQDAGKHHADLVEAVTQLRLTETITGASTLEITLIDPKRTLLRSKALTSRSTVAIDRAGFELVKVAKQGTSVSLTFEDISVAMLRRHNSLRKAAAGTTTRPAFVRTLIREEPDIPVVIAPGASRNLVEISRGSGSPTTGRSKVVGSGQVVDSGVEDTWTAAGRIMGEIGWRVFARHGTITIAPDSWLIAHNGKPYILSPDSKGVHNIDFDWDVGKPAAAATLEVDAEIHAILPGTPLTLQGVGIGSGAWLAESIERSLWNKRASVTAVRQQPTLPEPTNKGDGLGDGGDFGTGNWNLDFFEADDEFQLAEIGANGAGATGIDALTSVVSERFVHLAMAQRGKPYTYGARGPNTWDCAGFVYDMARRVGVNFPNPVSSQAAICRRAGSTMTIAQAAYTRGAVIWRQRGGGANDHIVISLGNGKNTIEAAGKAYGVRVGKIEGRDWTGAGAIPGIAVKVPSLRDTRPG